MGQGGGFISGILVGISPSTGLWRVELQRSSGTVSSTAWVGITTLATDGASTSYLDNLPLDNGIRNYRARHTASGYTAGAWSTRVSARPVNIQEFPGDEEQPIGG